MSQADIEYNKLILEIHKNGSWDTDGEVRPVYADGTNAYTKSIFGVQVKFQQGDIPLLTSKKVFTETAKKEMMLFWIHQTVQEKDFKDQNVKVWQQWFNEDGNLGRSYAYQFESHRNHKKEIIEVKPVIKEHHGELSEKAFGYKRNASGVGNKGNLKSIKNYSEKELKKLKNVWHNMLRRCYNKNSKDYPIYGGKGIFVEERWHLFENFLRDIRYLPQFFLAKEDCFEGWNLDKDYFSSNCYGPDSCVWLTNKENCLYRESNKPFKLIDKEGNEHIYLSIKQASLDFDFDSGDGSRYLRGKISRLKGLHLEYIETEFPLRYELSRNQVVELLKTIKKNPYSRRLMTSFWNYADTDKKELQECAWATEWNSRNEELDLILIQRSADIGLGVPFNWIQYYFLLCMVAHVSGLKVGTFTHQLGNVHYYDRHEETLLEQIKDKAYSQPIIKLNEKVKDFFDFTPQDILVFGYEHGPVRSMEVAE